MFINLSALCRRYLSSASVRVFHSSHLPSVEWPLHFIVFCNLSTLHRLFWIMWGTSSEELPFIQFTYFTSILKKRKTKGLFYARGRSIAWSAQICYIDFCSALRITLTFFGGGTAVEKKLERDFEIDGNPKPIEIISIQTDFT